MGSESDDVQIEDSDESLLDIKEINDLEFDIPPVAPPSLESVLWDMESEGSDNVSLHSYQSMTTKFRSLLSHCILQGLSVQIASAGDRVNAGLPTVITNSLKYVAVGTSHGYILAFDSEQSLCWCSHDIVTSEQGAVSALAFNLESTRLLVGYERGYIVMIDALNGDIIRRLPDAHAPQTAVLHLRFTFISNLALCGDSSGCVFLLAFNRRLGVRSSNSKCLFSGARGEVCVFEPLLQGQDIHFLNRTILVAMATLSKVIVISVRPRLKVLYNEQLPRISTSLPLISWQMASVGKTFQPVLAWARGSELHFTRVFTHGSSKNKIRLLPLRCVQLSYTIMALHWLGTRHLALLDTSENLRLYDVRSQKELEVLELANAGLVYSSAHFKALAVGGGVSEAFALAGERACYNSLSSRGDQLLILGTKAVHKVKLRTWAERLMYLTDQGRWAEALNLTAEEGANSSFSVFLLEKYLESLNQNTVDKESLTAAVNCCVKLGKIDILCNELMEAVTIDPICEDWYYSLLTDYIYNGVLTTLSPSVAQSLVAHLENKDVDLLEHVLLALDISCLDLHQVLTLCKKKKMYKAWIHITTTTLSDYTGPLVEFLSELTPDNNKLGNTMLVYVSSCLAGLGYPSGSIPEADIPRVKHDVLRCLKTVHSINIQGNERTYPYLRALLKYNTRECLNVIELAFTEIEFSGEMGQLQRQRLIQILMQIVVPPEFSDSQVINLVCFISRLIVSNNLQVDDTMLSVVIKSLMDVVGQPLSYRDHSEREQAWLDLLNAKKLIHLPINNVLEMALASNCFKVAEYLYEVKRDYKNIVSCYLLDSVRKAEVFHYIQKYINNPERCISDQFTCHFKELVTINSTKAGKIVLDHFSDSIEALSAQLNEEPDTQYTFLSEIINSDIKISAELAERYLDLLCSRNRMQASSYVQLSLCRSEEALKITKKYNAYAASAVILEQTGEWMEALNLLLEHEMIDDGVNLCIRGADNLDAEGAQKLWLTLLQHSGSAYNSSTRQLLHAAAPHVPPTQLLELVSNANFGDVRVLLKGILSDYSHDIEMLNTTLNLLDKDLHHNLAKSLSKHGKGISVPSVQCKLCQKPLTAHIGMDQEPMVAVWSCGHGFHSSCLKDAEVTTTCPECLLTAVPVPNLTTSTEHYPFRDKNRKSHVRPDLEGHF